jgi:hypothetical protein
MPHCHVYTGVYQAGDDERCFASRQAQRSLLDQTAAHHEVELDGMARLYLCSRAGLRGGSRQAVAQHWSIGPVGAVSRWLCRGLKLRASRLDANGLA